jgi:ferrochelatase
MPAMSQNSSNYDALLLVSFGGPEGPDDVMPFLRSVVQGKDVPDERLAAVARQYELFGGVSPINSQNRALLAALIAELNARGPHWPVYWGNLYWHPLLEDAVAQMAADSVGRCLAFATSPFGSPPGCRRCVEQIELARRSVGPLAPEIDKLRLYYNHPGFVEPLSERVAAAWSAIPPSRRETARLIFSAHSLPVEMAASCPYERQLRETCRLVVERLENDGIHANTCSTRWELAYQSRSGPPAAAWLEPDVGGLIRRLHAAGGLTDVVVAPLGFTAENKEVVYDLDVEVGRLCEELGVNMVRAAVVGSHPRFVTMIRELIEERLDPAAPRLALGKDGPWPDRCPADCCRVGKPASSN